VTSNQGLEFDRSLGCLSAPQGAELAARLSRLKLAPGEREAVHAAATRALAETLHQKLARVLLVELHAARKAGLLQGATPEERWQHFLDISSERQFWDGSSSHYPTLLARVGRIVDNRIAAALRFAARWAADRDRLCALCGAEPGALVAVGFGAGDTHAGGETVAVVTCEGGKLVYKPRPLAIDAVLERFLIRLGKDLDRRLAIRVPRVVDRADYGWAEFVPHRYAADAEELARYHEGVGHWLAVMRLLGGTDLHAENLIAHGASPVVVDCETLFTPETAPRASGYGDAADVAATLISGSVLASGLLPARGQALGWRGVDVSGIGALNGEQPEIMIPTIENAGTDEARIGMRPAMAAFVANHPSPEPTLADNWSHVLAGFDEMSQRLRAMPDLGERLAPFAPCRVRVVARATESYAELARMLWHPVSLHDEGAARARARDLLAKMAKNVPLASSDPAVIESEIDELLVGDIPVFTQVVGAGVDAACRSFRAADLARERNFVRTTLVSAYVGEGWMPKDGAFVSPALRSHDLDARRRRQAALVMRKLMESAITGSDGTITWVAPTLTPTGWAVQAMRADLYGGLAGAALVAGAYLREQRAGRADPIEEMEAVFAGLLHALNLFQDKRANEKRAGMPLRPPPLGLFLGQGSLIWVRLTLAAMGLDDGGVVRAAELGREIAPTAIADDSPDVLSGPAGAIVPLLMLARATGDAAFRQTAVALGDRVYERAHWDADKAHWTDARWPNGLGGFAHGASGMGWALSRLAAETDEARHREAAEGAFAFEDSLYDESEANWLDLRGLEGPKSAAAWCHGAIGIGLARRNDPKVLARAAAATERMGFGWNHCVCHGEMGSFELLEAAIAAGAGPKGLTQEVLLARVLTSLEDHGPLCGLLRDAFVPGLFTGLGGIAYQLLRAHPESGLPSILTPEG
jgi:class II lanthipeptide synthase